MSFTQTLYNTVFRRTSTYALAIIVGAVFFERFFDEVGDGLYDRINRGKQWKDLKKELALKQDAEEED